ncbi:MAG TPA: two-component system sensor histidine kinase CreC [Burkholderiaceae bacterium]|jgi:two-component system sensor histidine kinase CreC
MRLGLRLFFGFFLITGLTALLLLRVFSAEIKPSVREVTESIMVDTANLLAELAVDDLAQLKPGATLDDSRFAQAVKAYSQRPVSAAIWGMEKHKLDFRIYVTDAKGRVVLDSAQAPATGQDYSQWRDVNLSLRGEYGARSSREVEGSDRSTVLYVAAPVRRTGQVIGVVTVAEPLTAIQRFIDRAERRIWLAGLGLLLFSLAIGVAATLWLVGNVRRLRHYAQQAQAGQRPIVPQVPGELGDLAQAMDAMRERLDGREHIEHTVRALTHELKSPLAAMRGAGELLQDDLAAPDRQRFARQVVDQSERMRELVDRLLELSKLEMLRTPTHLENLQLDELVDEAVANLADRLTQKQLTVRWKQREALNITADRELLNLALSNLIGNAIDFAPEGSSLEWSLSKDGAMAVLSLRDFGPGVPAEAWPQLGERFFSTARPGSLIKGSGLGLAIVRRVAALHGGTLNFEPAEPGLRVLLRLTFSSSSSSSR